MTQHIKISGWNDCSDQFSATFFFGSPLTTLVPSCNYSNLLFDLKEKKKKKKKQL